MRKLSLIISFLCVFSSLSFAQTSFEAEDYPQNGDVFPMISYFTNPGDETVFISDFGLDNIVFDNITMFTDYLIDTIAFLNPVEYDVSGGFPNSTHLMRDGNQKIFIEKNTNHAQVIGFSGDMLNMGMELSIPLENPLTLMEFPTTLETNFSSQANGEYAMPVDALQSIIPSDYYDTFASNFDSIKVLISVEEAHDVIESQSVSINLGSVNNEQLTCLKEFVESYQEIDIYARFVLTGSWMPLSSIPSISDQLPMDLPMMDTSYTLNWWTPEYKLPLVQATTNQNQSEITNLKFHYNGETSVQALDLASIEVYPNPAIHQVRLSSLPKDGSYLIIINSQGKIEKRFSLNGNFITFACDQLANGWYMLQVFDQNDKPIAQQKLVVQ